MFSKVVFICTFLGTFLSASFSLANTSDFHSSQVNPKIFNPIKNKTANAVLRIRSEKGTTCSAALVGLNPPTAITARHCTDMDIFLYEGWTPKTIVKESFPGFPYIIKAGLLPGDMTILIYPQESKNDFLKNTKEHDLFKIDSSITLIPYQRVSFCGYGSKSSKLDQRVDVGILTCGENNVIKKNDDLLNHDELYSFYKRNPRLNFEQFPYPFKEIFIHHTLQNNINHYGDESQFGVGALSFTDMGKRGLGLYDKDSVQSIMAPGDSGGPMFIENENGKILLGVNSSVFDIRMNILGGIFWSVNHPWSQELIAKAQAMGADITN